MYSTCTSESQAWWCTAMSHSTADGRFPSSEKEQCWHADYLAGS